MQFHEFCLIFGTFNIFLPKKSVIAGNIYAMLEEKTKLKEKVDCLFFLSDMILAHWRNRQP